MDFRQYARSMKALGLGFQYKAADQASDDPRRVRIYDRGLNQAGYSRIGDLRRKGAIRYEHHFF